MGAAAPSYALPAEPMPEAEPAQGGGVSSGVALAALLLNVFVWPGLGSLVAGVQKGWAQGFLTLGGALLTLTGIGAGVGIPMALAAWVWGVVTGVQLLRGREG